MSPSLRSPDSPTGSRTRVPAPAAPSRSPEVAWRLRYEDYCRSQARELLNLLPGTAIRPLFRRAREGLADPVETAEADDPLSILVTYCRHLLPLPPFDVWREDVRRHPDAYRESRDPRWIRDPVTVDVRALDAEGRRWIASLDIRSDGDLWRGRITFRRPDDPGGFATGEIFREDGVEAVRDRFLEFDDRTLAAFLRSSLP